MNPKVAAPKAAPASRLGAGSPQAIPLTGADLALMVLIITEAVSINYNKATLAFKDRPSADNWKALVLSMHGVEFWHGADEAKKNKAAQRLHALGIGHWAQALKDLHSEAFEED